MFTPYRELFQIAGAKRISIAGFIARMPIAMDTIAIILFVHSVDSRYTVAGSLPALAALTTVVSSPLWAKAADRYGQYLVMRIAVPVRVCAMTGFIFLVLHNAPIWSWYIAILLAESASISFGSMVRRRWVHLIGNRESELLSRAYALESFFDEIIYIAGPILTTAVVATTIPAAGMILGIVFILIGAPLIATERRSDPAVSKHEGTEKLKSVLLNRKLQAIAIPLTIAGGSFSAINISVIAFCDEHKVKAMGGVLLGVWAIGGAVSAIINGVIQWRISHGVKYLSYLIGMTIISFAFPFIGSVYILATALFLQGLCIAPLLPNGLSMISDSIPPRQLTHAITLATAGIPLTGAISSFFAGRVIDSYSAATALWLPFAFLAVAVISTAPYLREYRS